MYRKATIAHVLSILFTRTQNVIISTDTKCCNGSRSTVNMIIPTYKQYCFFLAFTAVFQTMSQRFVEILIN